VGFSEGELGISLIGTSPTGNTVKTTEGRARIELNAQDVSGTTVATPEADSNLVGIRSNGATRFIFDAEGELHLTPSSGSSTVISPSASSSLMGGNVGIGTTTPANKLNIEGSGNALNVSSGASCSYIAAGSTSFTACSSRDIKENIEPFTVSNILGKIASVPVNRFDFINGSKGNVGLIAEDFYSVLGKGSNSTVSGQDVDMALWLAVQELAKENEELKARIAALESRI